MKRLARGLLFKIWHSESALRHHTSRNKGRNSDEFTPRRGHTSVDSCDSKQLPAKAEPVRPEPIVNLNEKEIGRGGTDDGSACSLFDDCHKLWSIAGLWLYPHLGISIGRYYFRG